MASACVNTISENFIDISPVKCPSSYGWMSPRISVGRDLDFPIREESSSKQLPAKGSPKKQLADKPSNAGPDPEDFVDFEFRLEDPVTMLPADELFSDGKLVPLHLTNVRQSVTSDNGSAGVRSLDTDSKPRLRKEIDPTDPYLFSPKAPTCSIRWKELLGLKKKLLYHQKQNEEHKLNTSTSTPTSTSSSRSIKYLLQYRSSKSTPNTSSSSATDLSLNLPLLDESVSVPSRFSLSSSSSSSHEHDDLPRLSLDTDKQSSATRRNSLSKVRSLSKHKKSFSSSENPTTTVSSSNRVVRSPMRRDQALTESSAMTHGISVDSPRMNASGKIVFHSLERSSSSPSTFNGGPRYKCRGMERSYSANVRVTPVLNVPVCSLRGTSKFGLPLFSSSSSSPQQKNRDNSSHHVGVIKRNQQQSNSRNRTTDRT